MDSITHLYHHGIAAAAAILPLAIVLVVCRFVDKLLFFLPSLSGIFLTMCLEVLHSQVEIRPQLYQELKEKGLHQLLVHRCVDHVPLVWSLIVSL